MTLIVGLVHEQQVYLAADSCGSNGHTYSLNAQPKLFVTGKFRGGYTSSFRMGQLLTFSFQPAARTEGQELMAYLVGPVVDSIRGCLKNGGYARCDSGEESGGTFLLSTEGRLFTVQGDYSVLENSAGYAACGSGTDYALASLHTTGQLPNLPPLERLHLALQAAERHVTTVRGPFWLLRPGSDTPEAFPHPEGLTQLERDRP